jgi:hypothetical protein
VNYRAHRAIGATRIFASARNGAAHGETGGGI